MKGRTFNAFGLCVGLAVGACGDRGQGPVSGDGPDELWALLRDDSLVLPGAVARTREAATAQPLPFNPTGFWTFDDCDPGQADLVSIYGLQKFAYRSVGVTCVPGRLGQAVALAARGDIVYVPDQPSFTFGDGVSVAGWFQPNRTDRTETLIRKRDGDTSAFALVLHRGRFRFIVGLADGRVASVNAPTAAHAGVFQHVAASYDGAVLRLYVDGQQVAERGVAGTIALASGPLLVGNDGTERRFDGLIDEVVFDLHALSAQQMLRLTCIPADASVIATPLTSAPTPPDVTASFDITVTNHNTPACSPVLYSLFVNSPGENIDLDADTISQVSDPVPGGGTTHFVIRATPFDSGHSGTFPFSFNLISLDGLFGTFGELSVVVSEPNGCHVNKAHELMIVNPSVTGDPIRTGWSGPPADPRTGAWSLRHLLEEMASTPADAPAVMEDLLRSFTTPQTINGFSVAARPGAARFLDKWPRTPDGHLDLARAPVRLKAIVDRIDLRDLDHGTAGRASFVFGLLDGNFEMEATLMFEYDLPATTETDVVGWAQAFHALGALPFSESYNAALQAITEQFVRRGARTDGLNGSALHVVRSNEFSFGTGLASEFRQFALSPATGRLAEVAVDQTPDDRFNLSPALAGFINSNRDALIAGTAVVPDQLGGQSFRAGSSNDFLELWNAPGVDGEARRAFALGTCNGCHSFIETRTELHHIRTQFTDDQGEPFLSPFLRGITVPDPVTGAPRTFNDMLRRRQDLESIVCAPEVGSGAAPRAALRGGLRRIH